MQPTDYIFFTIPVHCSARHKPFFSALIKTWYPTFIYCNIPLSSTAEAFNRSTGQKIDEDLASIRNRQNIQRLVLSGKIGEAIGLTEKLYPGLLETNPTLQFTLKVIDITMSI